MHSDKLRLPDAELQNKWTELSKILTRLNQRAGIGQLQKLISDAEHMDTDEDLRNEHNETLKAWEERDKIIDHGIGELKCEVADLKHIFSGVKHAVSDVKHEFSYVKHDVSDVKHKVANVQHTVSNVKRDVSDVKHDVSDMKHKVSNVQHTVANVKRDVSDVKHDVSDVKHKVSNVQHTVSNVKRDVSDMKHKVSNVQHTVANVKRDVSDVKHDVSDVKHKVSYVQHTVANVKHKVSDLNLKVSDVKHEIVGVKRQLDDGTKQKTKYQRVEELKDIKQDIINKNKQQYKTLPVSPVFDDIDDDLLHVYQTPKIYSVEPTEQKSKQINSYENIFCNNSKICDHIYITGDAGVGKTSFCRRLCLLWYMAKRRVAVDNEALKKDIDYISKFDYVFYITLRETRRTHVLDMIIDLFRDSDNEKYEPKLIKSVLRDEQCLVLLDGLDEWSPESGGVKKYKIPEQVYSENCVYITTCRPYRLESARLSHKKDIDHQIQMTGISGRSCQCYVQKVVDYMNRLKSCHRKSSDFEEEVKKCGLIKQLCIPIITSHLVVLWYERTLTGMPKAAMYGNILEMLFKRAEEKKVQFPLSTPSKSTNQLPNALSGLRYLNKYISFIYKVCYLSFRSMFKKDENAASLVFTRDQLESEPYCFSIEETDFLCKIGILSRNEVFGCCLDRELKISFIHKSYLEVFAALFISSFDSSNLFTDVTKRWKCLDDVLPCENLLPLLAGFSYDGLKQLFDNIYLSITDDLTLIRRNAIFHHDQYPYRDQMKSLQNIVVNCFKECSTSKTIVLKMEDFVFDNSNIDILRQLLLLNATCVKSIHSVKGEYYPEFDQIHCLQHLNVGKVSSVKYEKFTLYMSQNTSTLDTICIKGGILNAILVPELLVKSFHHLTSLSLSYVKMQHNGLHDLVKYLSDNVLIENLKLYHVYCDNHQYDDCDCTLTLNLPKHTKLITLCLEYVNILCNNVNSNCLQSITLFPLTEMIFRRCYCDVFNRIKDSQLEHLHITGYPGYMSDCNTMKTLTSTVKSLPCIKSLELCYMKLPDDVILQLHPDVTQVKIELDSVTMSRQWFHCFVQSCVNSKSQIKAELRLCKIPSVDAETQMELSEEESVKYISEYLENISIINIAFKSDVRLCFETVNV